MSYDKLKYIALCGAVITSVTGLTLNSLGTRKIKSSPLYQEAMELLRKNPTAVKILGTPIKDYKVQLNEDGVKGYDGELCWMTVPVQGPNDKGRLRYWFTFEEPHRVVKVELAIEKAPGKKLVIKDDTG